MSSTKIQNIKATKERKPKASLLLKAMKSKIQALLLIEARMELIERKAQQYQLLFQVPSLGQVIVGKGGVNTMFYKVGEQERVLCLPDALLKQIDLWLALSQAVTYCIVLDKKVIKKNLSKKEAKAFKARKGAYLCEVKDGKRTKQFKMSKSLFGLDWKAINKEPS